MPFNVENSPTLGPRGDYKYVVDHGKGVWLQRVTNEMMDSGHNSFQLHWGDRVFLLESHLGNFEKTFGEIKVHPFGMSHLGETEGLVSDKFLDEEDRADVARLAAEALISFGFFYDGAEQPPGWWRVEIDGRWYTSADFDSEIGHA
jgi:hypothetical protein